MVDFKRISVPLDKLLLDPNNYRFRDLPNFTSVNVSRIHEPRVQEAAYQRLKSIGSFGVRELKDSIRTNGFVPLDQVLVRPYGKEEEGLFLIVEGNRRVAALKWLLEEHAGGVVTLEANDVERLSNPEVLMVAPQEGDQDALFNVIMAIRHVSGIRQWGTYQQARLVTELLDSGLDLQTVGERLAMHPREVARRYRAAKALEKMQGDEEYGEYVKPEMYGVFHEIISIPELRDGWLGWSPNTYEFGNPEARQQLYKLISPITDDSGEVTGEPKITKGDQARKLKTVVAHEDALKALLEDATTFDDAYAIAYADEREANTQTNLLESASRTVGLMDRLSVPDLVNLTTAQIDSLIELIDKTQTMLKNRDKLLKE